jgi:hypothetical protein
VIALGDKPKVLVVVDNVDPDNLACALAATNPLFGFNVVGVIVTGRPATLDRSAGIDESSVLHSRKVRRGNARRMYEFLRYAGRYNVPVFEGLVAPRTLVPHGVHIDEELLSLSESTSEITIDGNFIDPYEMLLSLEGPIHVIVGGPLSEVAALIEDPEIASRLGIITAQLGMFGFGDVSVMGGARHNLEPVQLGLMGEVRRPLLEQGDERLARVLVEMVERIAFAEIEHLTLLGWRLQDLETYIVTYYCYIYNHYLLINLLHQ